MLKKTGAGKVARSSAVPVGGLRAALYNFDIDGAELKPEHLRFLADQALPILQRSSSRCWLQGSASHAGSESHNLELSRWRVDAVVVYLVNKGADRSRLTPSHVGESMANLTVLEADGDRAVSLLCAPLMAPPVRRDPPPESEGPKLSTQFKIRELGGLSAGFGPVGLDNIYFQIWDVKHHLTTFYVYDAAGFGKGMKAGPPLSATLEGPWNDFVTTGSLSTNEFGGAARFTTAGTMWWTRNFVNFMGLPRTIKTNPNPLKIDTGFTVGAGGSTSVGVMVLGPTFPFKGP